VHHDIDTLDGLPNDIRIGEIAAMNGDAQGIQQGGIAGIARDGADLVPTGDGSLGQMTADKPCSAGDKESMGHPARSLSDRMDNAVFLEVVAKFGKGPGIEAPAPRDGSRINELIVECP
jgi:hypothetical protein